MKRIIYTLIGVILSVSAWAQNVARIDGSEYATLADAITAAQNGETVTLIADAAVNSMITIADGKTVTVDMNGKNISGSSYFQVTHGRLNLTGEGTYSTSAVYALKVVGATTDQGADYSVVSVGENVTVESTHSTYGYVAMVSYDTSVKPNNASYGAKIDFNGKGEGRLGLYVNGTIKANSGNVPEVIVGAKAVIKSDDYAVYAAGYANYTVNGTLIGEGGIEAKGGKVVVNDGAVITATAAEQSHTTNSDGTSTKGYAIVSVTNTGYAGNDIEVKGGTITGNILSLDDHSGSDIETGLEVSGGTFTVAVPEQYCAGGFIPKDNGDGTYGVKEGTYVAQIEETKYETMADALTAATSGQTIKLLDNIVLASVSDWKESVNLDKNGFTLTVNAFNVVDSKACYIPFDFTATTATYTRNVASNLWGTVCVPFTLKSCDEYTLYQIVSIDDASLVVEEIAEDVAPGTPVIFKTASAVVSVSFSTENAEVASGAPVAATELIGTYSEQVITENLTSKYYINGDKFHQAKVSLTVPMYRAYISLSSPSPAKQSVLSIIFGEKNTTAIGSVETGDKVMSAIYDESGRKLTAPRKGLNIVKLSDGKAVKLIIK